MEKNKTSTKEFKVKSSEIIKKIKELVKEGNIRKVILKDEKGKVFAEFPLTLGVVGVALLPILAAIGTIAALVANLTIVVEKQDK
jgi:hypothetical protein